LIYLPGHRPLQQSVPGFHAATLMFSHTPAGAQFFLQSALKSKFGFHFRCNVIYSAPPGATFPDSNLLHCHSSTIFSAPAQLSVQLAFQIARKASRKQVGSNTAAASSLLSHQELVLQPNGSLDNMKESQNQVFPLQHNLLCSHRSYISPSKLDPLVQQHYLFCSHRSPVPRPTYHLDS